MRFSLLSYHDLPAFFPQILFVASTVATLLTPIRHSLLVSCVAWLVILVSTTWYLRRRSQGGKGPRNRLSWSAGALFTLASLCERAAWDKDGIAWSKSLLPLMVHLLLHTEPFASSLAIQRDITSIKSGHPWAGLGLILGAAIVSKPYTAPPTIAFGLSSAFFTSIAICLVHCASTAFKDGRFSAVRGHASPVGPGLPQAASSREETDHIYLILRDMSVVGSIASGIATLMVEDLRINELTWNTAMLVAGDHWRRIQPGYMIIVCLLMALVISSRNVSMISLIYQQGPFKVAFILFGASFVARIFTSLSVIQLAIAAPLGYLGSIYMKSSGLAEESLFGVAVSSRPKQLAVVLPIISICVITISTLRSISPPLPLGPPPSLTPWADLLPHSDRPKSVSYSQDHPIAQLVDSNGHLFRAKLSKQSKTISEAVTEYKRRYGINPPPHFDKWYEFAKRNGVELIDEFDTIHQTLLPFWALKPSTVRARAREVLGYDKNFVIGLFIRDGKILDIKDGPEWQKEATVGMLKEFVHLLPDMDIAMNVHDEPRVTVPFNRLSRMVEIAKTVKLPAALKNTSPRNSFSGKPDDISPGQHVPLSTVTRFNVFAHQATWTHSRLSCPPDTPAGAFEDDVPDNRAAYAISELGFVFNYTAFTDICVSPSLENRFGFFDRPNAYNVVQDLFPIFSQSKISSYQDILFPSPWYWYGKVPYQELKDMSWDSKKEQLYWRGSTTGGFSREGGWRRHHRQHVIQRLNAPDEALILKKGPTPDGGDKPNNIYHPEKAPRKSFAELIDSKFSHFGQCDEADCAAQEAFFERAEPADQYDAFKYKHLLDIDGNAFSGRFYAFLHSKSLVYKIAIFQEWHMEWLQPWLHFIPLSLRGDEWLETVRWFSNKEEGGAAKAKQLADISRDWAQKSLRKVDMEVWFCRLLLEYGRIVDDDRDNIGYTV